MSALRDLLPALVFAMGAGFIGFQLWNALARGVVSGRGETYARRRQPVLFWLHVAVYGTLVAAIGVYGALVAYDAITGAAAGGVSRHYPQRAAERGIEGDAVLSCTLTPQKRFTACEVLSETPPGYGFGEAALGVAREMTATGRSRSGQALSPGARVTLPVRFKIPERP